MSKVTISVVTVPTDLPSGITAGALRVAILDLTGATVATQDVTGVTAAFTGVADGDYVASAVRLDDTGANLGVAVTAAFSVTIVPPVAQYDAPASLTVLVEAE
jgi:hypothetical protein